MGFLLLMTFFTTYMAKAQETLLRTTQQQLRMYVVNEAQDVRSKLSTKSSQNR